MVASLNGNIFRVTGPLWRESIGHRWIPLTKARDAVLWCFIWFVPEQLVEKTVETQVIWDAIALIMTSLLLTFASIQIDSTKASYNIKVYMIEIKQIIGFHHQVKEFNISQNAQKYICPIQIFNLRLNHKISLTLGAPFANKDYL